jgi:hypothetical protein
MYFSKRRRKSFLKRRLLRFNSNTSPSTRLRRPEPALAGRASVLGKRTFGAITPPALFFLRVVGELGFPLHRRRTRPPRCAGSTRSSGSRGRSGGLRRRDGSIGSGLQSDTWLRRSGVLHDPDHGVLAPFSGLHRQTHRWNDERFR